MKSCVGACVVSCHRFTWRGQNNCESPIKPVIVLKNRHGMDHMDVCAGDVKFSIEAYRLFQS